MYRPNILRENETQYPLDLGLKADYTLLVKRPDLFLMMNKKNDKYCNSSTQQTTNWNQGKALECIDTTI